MFPVGAFNLSQAAAIFNPFLNKVINSFTDKLNSELISKRLSPY
jgi:hypothetical protein